MASESTRHSSLEWNHIERNEADLPEKQDNSLNAGRILEWFMF